MTERMYRTQILLEPAQHDALAAIARREKRSVSDVVREMIRQQLEKRAQDADEELRRRLEGLERVRQHREDLLRELGGKPMDFDVVEYIRQLREERSRRAFGDLDARR
jgi:predicted CopG family antitoxin